MSQAEVTPSVSLNYYVDVLRRKWWVVLLGVVLGIAVAFAYSSLVPRVASATAAVAVNVISTDPFSASRAASGLIDSAGEAQVASSYAVAERAADRLGEGFTAESVREAVEVTGVADTAILRIIASASTAAQAQSVANAVAEEFLEFRSEQAQTRIARTLDRSNERLAELRTELQEVDQRIAAAEEGSRATTQAESDRSLLTMQINAVLSQAASTESIDTTGGTVLSPAQHNPVVWSPANASILLSGAAAGFGFGLLGAFLMNVPRSRVRSAHDVSLNGGFTVLGELLQRHAMLPPSGQDLAELRVIRERLMADRHLETRTGVMVLLDETGNRSSSSEPLSLAFVIALSGVPVEFVALALSEPELAELRARLRLRPDQSSSGIRYRSDLNPAFRLFVPSAEGLAAADEPISTSLRREIEDLRGRTLVMLSLPSESGAATRLAACRLADMAVFLLGRGVTKWAELRKASADVRGMGSHVLGSVLVNRDRALVSRDRDQHDDVGHEDSQARHAETDVNVSINSVRERS